MSKKKLSKLSDLQFDSKNINKGSEFGSALLTKSLQEVGAGRSVLADKNGVLIAGNKTIEAAGQLGITKIKVVETSGDEIVVVQRTDLDINSPNGAKMKVLDNTVSKHNYIEDAEVAEAVCEEYDLNPVELGLEVKENEVTDDGFDAEPPKKAITVLGDIYELNQHRVLCGDSTNSDDVAKLMNGKKADMVFTDPPYGVSYVGKTEQEMPVHNDGKEELEPLLLASFKNYDIFCKEGTPIYILHPAGANSLIFGNVVLKIGWKIHETLVWVKDSMVMGYSDYHYKHEPILLCYKKGEGRFGRGGKNWYGDNSQVSVWEFPRPKASREHPTAKPTELVGKAISNSSKRGDLVLDLFGGGGSCLIACESLERTAHLQELSGNYCDVIVARWLKFMQSPSNATGKAITIKRNGKELSVKEQQKYLDAVFPPTK